MHKTEESVQKCLKGSDKERRATFTQLKRIGIFKYNMQIAGREGAVLLRERVRKNVRQAPLTSEREVLQVGTVFRQLGK